MNNRSPFYILFSLFFVSCATTPSGSPDWEQVYQRSLRGVQFQAQGGTLFISTDFNHDVPKEQLASQILRAAKSWNPSGRWPYGGMALLEPPISERDFWVVVLAKLSNREFLLYQFESNEEREARIDKFLDSLD